MFFRQTTKKKPKISQKIIKKLAFSYILLIDWIILTFKNMQKIYKNRAEIM